MPEVRITLPDESVKVFDHNPTVLEVAESIGSRLAQDTVGGQINGQKEVIDLRTQLKDGTRLSIVTARSAEGLEVIRHSAAHAMAQAVQNLWPEVKVTIGPVIDSGFYYDFDTERTFTPECLEKIEEELKKVIKAAAPIRREDWSSDQAIKRFREMGERFKVELIEDLKTDQVGIYFSGEDWFDLCRGPHVQHMGQIKAVKILSLAGSYWRGDENRERLQRIYATAFADKKELKEYLHNLEEAKKRDHRKLGKDLGLFHFNQLSPGAPFFTAKGSVIYNQLVDFMRDKYRKYGYGEVITPQIFDVDLYHQSGHYENYRENMFFSQIDERDFSVKPMNCPGHCVLYSMDKHSYRDLPLRIADFGRLHRNERSGVMHGLTRVRSFCQDDAHIFCTMEQMQEEIQSFMKLLAEVYQKLGMTEYRIYLSTRPAKRMGSDEIWDQAEGALRSALEKMNLKYEVNPGDGAFYGPKLDIMFVDALKRDWQLGTLQCDFNMPEAFSLKYKGEDNADHAPVMLHRAILGSLERFIGVYLEHTAGHLPMWLAPTQVRILNVTDHQQEYCQEIYEALHSEGLRVHLDDRSEKLGYKIREAQLLKTPYMLIIGDKEKENGTVSIRLRNGDTKYGVKLKEFVHTVVTENRSRTLVSPYLLETKTQSQEVTAEF
ncbi:MAG: threonine--tRNA ligase [Bdellovibrionales bacterium]|nr:threonine--tRNA ligase [Bdellovibrionales bacterium]